MLKMFLNLSVLFITAGLCWGEQKLVISIQPGKNYKTVRNMGFLKIIMIPQMAVWLEDGNGKFITNIFVTQKSAKSDWYGGDKVRRPEALPVWSHSMGIQYSDGLFMPDKKHPLPDAVTGATPKGEYLIEWTYPSDFSFRKYNIYAEINSSYDYNAKYRENLAKTNQYYNGVNGQPSIVYKAGIEFGSMKPGLNMSPIGHGEVLGRDGSVNTNLTDIKEALQILDSIKVSIENK